MWTAGTGESLGQVKIITKSFIKIRTWLGLMTWVKVKSFHFLSCLFSWWSWLVPSCNFNSDKYNSVLLNLFGKLFLFSLTCYKSIAEKNRERNKNKIVKCPSSQTGTELVCLKVLNLRNEQAVKRKQLFCGYVCLMPSFQYSSLPKEVLVLRFFFLF